MNKIKIHLLFISVILGILLAEKTTGQDINKINHVTFELHHSRRVPHNKVIIELTKKYDKTSSIHLFSVPMNNNSEWENTKIDTTYFIDTKTFDNIVLSVIKLTKIDVLKAMESGRDGTVCKIEFGTFGNNVSYKFWSLDYDTNKRGLQDFLEACKLIITTAHLKPSEIL